MGLFAPEVMQIIRLSKELNDKNQLGLSMLMMGKMDIYMTAEQFEDISFAFGYGYKVCDYDLIKTDDKVDSYKLFNLFGFKEVRALDISDYEGADIVFDLTEKKLPQNLYEKFDFVIDGGTLEHIFDIKTAMENMSRLVKPGGIIYHMLPCVGYIDHGFFNFSPTFFRDYYYTYNWDIINLRFCLLYINSNKYVLTYSQDTRLFSKEDVIKELNGYISHRYPSDVHNILVECIAKKRETQTDYKSVIQNVYK